MSHKTHVILAPKEPSIPAQGATLGTGEGDDRAFQRNAASRLMRTRSQFGETRRDFGSNGAQHTSPGCNPGYG